MSNSQEQFLLKIFSGPHQGAEIVLNPGKTVLGSHPDADIILSDTFIADKQLEFSIEGGQVQVTALANPVHVDGKLLKGEGVPLEPFKFITLGTTQLVLAPKGTEWPKLSLADAPQSLEAYNPESPEENPPSEPNSESQPREHSAAASRPVMYLIGGVLGLFAVLFLLFAVISGSSTPSVEEQNIDVAEVSALLTDQINELNLSEALTVTRQSEGSSTLVVSGYLPSNEMRRDVERSLRSITDNLIFRIRSLEALVQGTEEVVNTLKLPPLKIQATGDGGVILSGYLPTQEDFETLEMSVMRDVPGVRYVTDDVLTAREATVMAGDILGSANLSDKVFIVPGVDTLHARGFLAEQQGPEWNKAYQQLALLFSDYAKLKNEVQVLKAREFLKYLLNQEIDSVVPGRLGWISLDNGQKLFIGAQLPAGYIVDSITEDAIYLRKGGSRLRFSLSEG